MGTLSSREKGVGKSIQIIDNLKSWEEKWKKASDEKKNEMLSTDRPL